MPICSLCHVESLIPIELNCKHNYCFLCLFYDVYNKSNCPDCGNVNDPLNIFDMNKISNIDTSNYYLWLYSSNYGNTWWCYKKDMCEKLEILFQDYCLRKKLLSDNEQIKDNAISLSLKKVNKTKIFSLLNDTDDFKELNITSNSLDVEFCDDSTLTTPKIVKIPSQIASYTINTYGSEYKLDFDLMKQINLGDVSKKRNIKRIEIPTHMRVYSVNDMINYLINNCFVLGVAGKKF